jgi:hypothetical protein
MFHLRGPMSPLDMILVVTYIIYVKKWIFDVIWLGRPLFDLNLIKVH